LSIAFGLLFGQFSSFFFSFLLFFCFFSLFLADALIKASFLEDSENVFF
jgi:hypothetical protein